MYILNVTDNLSLFYVFLRSLKGDKKYIKEFCDLQMKNICKWYLSQKETTDVIVSASPEFLIKELCDRLGVRCIASKVDYTTGKYFKKSCKGKQKLIQFKEKFPDEIIGKSYGNSKSDMYMILEGKEGYMVKNISIDKFEMQRVK